MYKKLLGILIIAIFLITSVGVISASDDSISVEIKWDDDSNAPSEVTVNLIKDGQVVDSAKLNSDDSWKTTFKVDEDGDYDVELSEISGYSTVITGNASSGFVISNSIMGDDLLDSDDTSQLDDSSDDEVLGDSSDNETLDSSDVAVLTDNDTSGSDNSSGNDNNSSNSDDNSTDDDTNSTDDDTNSTDDEDDSESVTTTKTTTTTTTTKVVKENDKKPANNTTATNNKNTGFPLAVLVVALFVVVFVPFTRKK